MPATMALFEPDKEGHRYQPLLHDYFDCYTLMLC